MSPIPKLAAVNAGSALLPRRAFSAARPLTRAESDEKTLPAMLLVTLLHMTALLWLILPSEPAPSEQPVLSFTITLMDISSSPNSLSSAASAASNPSQKQEKAAEETVTAKAAARPKKQAKPVATPSPRTNAPLSHSAQQQTAVLSTMTPATFDAAYLNNPAPAYPSLSRRMGEQGSVMLSVFVNAQGRAETVQLKQTSGFDRLDNAARDAVKNWRFIAAKQGDQLVASWVQVPVKFVLE